MNSYSFNIEMGVNEDGSTAYQLFVIEAESFNEARGKLAEIIAGLQS